MNMGLLTLAMTIGQPVMPAVPPPALPADPFLFVTVTTPAGAKVTWQPHAADAATTNGPVGLRPGYPYRFQVSDIAGAKGTNLYPSIEVRGSLVPRPGLPDVSKHPVPILLSDHDIAQDELAEDAVLGGVAVEVEGLRIVARGEIDHLGFGQ